MVVRRLNGGAHLISNGLYSRQDMSEGILDIRGDSHRGVEPERLWRRLLDYPIARRYPIDSHRSKRHGDTSYSGRRRKWGVVGNQHAPQSLHEDASERVDAGTTCICRK